MKKLSLLKLNAQRVLQKEEKKRIRGGNCQSWACQCSGKEQETLNVDDTLEKNDKLGYFEFGFIEVLFGFGQIKACLNPKYPLS